MDVKRVTNSLQLIGKVYKPILDNSAQHIIPEAVASVRASRAQYDYARQNQTRGLLPEPWGYTIQHQTPLKFLSVSVPHSIEFQVDVYCDVRWAEEDTPVTQDIKIRVWSNHNDTIFDANRDSQVIFEELTKADRSHSGRVVSRIHFDRANLSKNPGNIYHPEYHLQFGGIPEVYELCWHPEKVNIPRLNYQPLELFLACQIVAANFFPDVYSNEIREKAEWRQELIYYQDLILLNYYQKCLDTITAKGSLLDALRI